MTQKNVMMQDKSITKVTDAFKQSHKTPDVFMRGISAI